MGNAKAAQGSEQWYCVARLIAVPVYGSIQMRYNQSMKQYLLVVFSLILIGCNSAKRTLASKGIPYSPDRFITAARHGDTETVRQFLQAGICQTQGVCGQALGQAAYTGHADTVAAILDTDTFDPSQSDLSAALIEAANGDHAVIAKVLIDAGATAESRDAERALINAISLNHTDTVRELLDAGANPDARLPNLQFTPLTLAAVHGHTDIAKALIDDGADVDAQSQTGNTALELAACAGNSALVDYLITNDANINVIDSQGKTALALCKSNTCRCNEQIVASLTKGPQP
jgi:ankyrin repeat protein